MGGFHIPFTQKVTDREINDVLDLKGQLKEYDADEHALTIEEVAKKHDTNVNAKDPKSSKGLSAAEAKARFEKYGPNILTPPKDLPEIVKYLLHYVDPFMILLEAAAVLCFIAYGLDTKQAINLYLAIVLLAIVILTSTISYIQERQSGKLMDSIKNLLPQNCLVVRDGAERKMPAIELVVGDVVRVRSGDKIPADLRIIDATGTYVDNSSLTGENEPQPRLPKVCKGIPNEAQNLAFYSSLVTAGDAIGIVIKTGDNTFIGQIATASTGDKKTSTLELEVRRFVRFITILALGMGVIFFIIGVSIDHKDGFAIITTLINTIGVIVANVPEGLPATVTACLTIAARRLSVKHVWVKKLECVETLGSTTLIASDKTGTLTQNRMTVVHSWVDGKVFATLADDEEYEEFDEAQSTPAYLLRIAALCSRAKFEAVESPDGEEIPLNDRPIIGDASESAILRLCEGRFHTETVRNKYPKVFEIPFNSTNKFQISVHGRPKDESKVVKLSAALKKNERESMDKARKSVDGRKSVDPGRMSVDARPSFDIKEWKQTKKSDKYGYDLLGRVSIDHRKSLEQTRAREQMAVERQRAEQKAILENIERAKSNNRRILVIKGAPEVVLDKCSKYMHKGKEKAVDAEFKEKFAKTILKLASYGERVLGFAQYYYEDELDPAEYHAEKLNYPLKDYTFVGFFALMDPPKEGVGNSILECKTAGLRVVMVTGDHPETAKAIAKKINLLTYPTKEDVAAEKKIPMSDINDDDIKSAVVNGQTLRTFTEEDWAIVTKKKEVVFARTSPQQKLLIVDHFQRMCNDIVAVTGDGVNDKPALSQANIGVAMGSGSDVAIEAAAIILLDDDFTSIVNAVKEGRVIFDNLRKSIAYTLSHLIPEVIPFLLNVIIGLPLGLSAVLILCIDLGTEMAPAISLAYELPEGDIMSRAPRNAKTERLVTIPTLLYSYLQLGIIETGAALANYFYIMAFYGFSASLLFQKTGFFVDGAPDLIDANGIARNAAYQVGAVREAQTMYFVTIVMCQAANLIACKTRTTSVFSHGFWNMRLNLGILVEFIIMLLLVWVPFLNVGFQTKPPYGPFQSWFIPLPFCAFIFIWSEIRKLICRNFPHSRFAKVFAW